MKVKFVPQNIECEIKLGESVMHVAQDNGIYIKSVCKGVPSCAECRVRIVDGDHNVLPPGSEELSLIGTGYFIDRRRLACQLKCFGDITVDMTEQLEKEQEILSGPKKKFLVHDDRVEDATAIRTSIQDEDQEEENINAALFDLDTEDDQDELDEVKEVTPSEAAQELSEGREPREKQAQGSRRRKRRRGSRRGRGGGGGGGGGHSGGPRGSRNPHGRGR